MMSKRIWVYFAYLIMINSSYADPQLDCRSKYRDAGMEVSNLQSVCKTESQINVSQTPHFLQCLKTYVGLNDSKWYDTCDTKEWIEYSTHDGFKQCLKVFKKIAADGFVKNWKEICNDENRLSAVSSNSKGFRTCLSVFKSMEENIKEPNWMFRCDSVPRVNLQKGSDFRKCLEIFKDVEDEKWFDHCDDERVVSLVNDPMLKTCIQAQASNVRQNSSGILPLEDELFSLVQRNCTSKEAIEKSMYGGVIAPGEVNPGESLDSSELEKLGNESLEIKPLGATHDSPTEPGDSKDGI